MAMSWSRSMSTVIIFSHFPISFSTHNVWGLSTATCKQYSMMYYLLSIPDVVLLLSSAQEQPDLPLISGLWLLAPIHAMSLVQRNGANSSSRLSEAQSWKGTRYCTWWSQDLKGWVDGKMVLREGLCYIYIFTCIENLKMNCVGWCFPWRRRLCTLHFAPDLFLKLFSVLPGFLLADTFYFPHWLWHTFATQAITHTLLYVIHPSFVRLFICTSGLWSTPSFFSKAN